MNHKLFLLLLVLQSAFLFSLESKAQTSTYKIQNSIYSTPQSISVINNTPLPRVKKSERDSIQIKTIALPKSAYIIAHSQSETKYYSDFSINTLRFQDPLKHIKNINFKYLLGELEVEAKSKEDKNLDNAVSTLLDYVKNDSIRNMVTYLKSYIEKRQTEDALKELSKKIELEQELLEQNDSLSKDDKFELQNDSKKYAELFDYIENDSVHQWIREISRDSVSFAVKNAMNDSLAFWINNGKTDFKRFWLKKSKKDSIGIWLQNTASKGIKILYDDDIYQESVRNTKRKGANVKLKKEISPNGFKLAKLKKYKRYVDIWKFGTIVKLDFNQGHVSKEWAEGGESSISTLAGIKSFANYKKNKTSWENTIDFEYGLLKSGDNEFRKNQDKLEINTKFGHLAFKKWYYTSMFNLKTQFVRGYNYSDDKERKLVSNFFAPAYILGSIGLDYKPKPNFSMLLSPFTAKYTIVNDTTNIDQTAFGIDANEKIKKEVGAYIKLLHKWKITKEISMENKLEFYSSYSNTAKNIDVDWQFVLNLPISQYLTTSISTYLISDDDTGTKVQFKENLAVGIRYQF
ncbi:DUF3078 domain-containing protein [Ancylomarina sp. 16SWW S1-10-2]|uniref:DUF3078 domain-containing protein n=1 Tax=Ancylomarina sp. 16SWW S1-10-2 TaxID=2499681 RepID=UPI0012ADE021|nr:DUF3078 domain-containing protein [Ancylomarina sp. 16SWW S1-10-2]MRT93994.1 DUF3078 domain-containing protein [Ancylomarina sp. 16SWW S1-10-2]